MIIRFTEKNKDVNSGKGFFANRLIPALERLGVDVTKEQKDYVDIDFQMNKWKYKPKRCKKTVIRLGPAHVDTNQDWKDLNMRKWKSVKRADGIVYQSGYSKRICRTFIGKPKGKEIIIYNGDNPGEYIDVKKWPAPFKYNFLASTRKWIPQKRLKDIIKAYKMAGIEDSCLWIAGQVLGNEKKYSDRSIQFLGNCEPRTLARLYRSCNTLISVVYVDACPNSVVEALNAGCFIICTDQGGTKELVDENTGIVIKDKPFKFKPVDLEKPPKLDIKRLAMAMIQSIGKNRTIPDRFNINNIAKQYLDFFYELLGKEKIEESGTKDIEECEGITS